MQQIIPFPWSFWLGLLALAAATFLSFFWLVLVNLSPGAVHKLEDSDEAMATRLDYCLRQRDQLRIIIRILHFLMVVLGLFSYLSWVSATDLGSLAVWLWSGLAMVLYLILPELAAYGFPGYNSWRIVAAMAPLVRLASWLVLPLAWPLLGWHNLIQQYWDQAETEDEKATVEDEIRSLIELDESSEQGERELESDERRMIRGVFDLDDTLVREIMTPRIDLRAIEETATLAELKGLIVESGHSRIPIYRQSIDHITGLVYAKDLLVSRLEDDWPLTETRELQHPPIFIPETKNVGDLLAEFQQNRSHIAIVIDEYGGTEGVVTMEDIIEEIVGEIHDEHDLAEPLRELPRQRLDGDIEVDGRTSIYDMNKQFDLDLPEGEDFDTIAGYVTAQLGRIPRVGEMASSERTRITVLEADRRRVLRVKITILPEADQPGPDSS